jgi:hypothetical protein
MPFGLGFFATAGASSATAGGFDLLETQLLSGSTSSVTFASLSAYASTYKHLQIRGSHYQATPGETALLQFNADTASNYRAHTLRANGATVTSADFGSRTSMVLGVDAPDSTTPCAFVCDILDAFASTKNKTIRVMAGSDETTRINFFSGIWLNTNALTELKVLSSSGNFGSRTRFSLYGLKG